MAVPIQNIYYLLCYAWDRLEARNLIDAGSVPGHRTENLLALVLDAGMRRLFKQGLDRGYVASEVETRRLRGKLLLSASVRRSLLPVGRVACAVDDLTYDVQHNRVIKAALRSLMPLPDLDERLRRTLHRHS